MKLSTIIAAAGLALAAAGAGTAADAQRYDHHDRGSHYRGHDRGRHGHYAGRGFRGPRCHTEWRHHRRVRVCR